MVTFFLVPPSGSRVTWRQTVQPYIKSTQVFSCPSNPRTGRDAAPSAAPDQYPAVAQHYSTNARMNSGSGALMMAGIDKPAQKIWAAEARDGDRQTMFEDWGSTAATTTTAGNGMFAGHLGTAVYLFADGHVKAMRPTQTATPLNMWGRMNDSPNSICNNGIYTKINCDTVSNNQIAALAELESRFD